MISARPFFRLPTSTFTVASGAGVGAGAGLGLGAAGAAAGSARAQATASSGTRRRFTRGILLSEEGDRVVQRMQDHPRDDRAGLLVEQAEDEAEGDQRRHRAETREGVQDAEDRARDQRRGPPRQP